MPQDTGPGETPLPRMDPVACVEVGRLLAAARGERHLSPADVSSQLLLSSAQIHGLEHGTAHAFHNAVFFAKALKKYAAFLGVRSPLLSHILVFESSSEADASDASSTPPAPSERGTSMPEWMSRPRVVVAAGLVVVCAVGAVVSWNRAPREGGGTPLAPSNVADAGGGSFAPGEGAAPGSSAMPSADQSAGQVALSRSAWVFVRYADGTVVERTLQSGGSLSLPSVPVYLAVGAGDGVTLTLGGRRADLAPYTRDGEVRIGTAELAAIASPEQ